MRDDEARGGPSQHAAPFLREVDGMTLPPNNYVSQDPSGRMWGTVSTRLIPRHLD